MVNIKALNAVFTTENCIHLRLFSLTKNIHFLNYLILFLWIAFYHAKTAFWKLSSSNLWASLGIYLRKVLQIHIKVKVQVSSLYYKWENSPCLDTKLVSLEIFLELIILLPLEEQTGNSGGLSWVRNQKGVMRLCREKIRRAKTQLQLNMAKAVKNKIFL